MCAVYKSHYRGKDGRKKPSWRMVVRIEGHPTVSESFDRKEEALDREEEIRNSIKRGKFNFSAAKAKFTYSDLIERMRGDSVFRRLKSEKSAGSQYAYWVERLGPYALILITPDLIERERSLLLEKLTSKGTKLAPASVNRYLAVLRGTLSYGVKRLRWIDENPASNFVQVEGSRGGGKIISVRELKNLLAACRESGSPYLFSITLLALTTGCRRGEILKLEWRDVDFENRIATLRASNTKTGQTRSVALTDSVLVELKRLYETREEHKPRVFASKTAFGQLDFKKSWYSAVARAGISNGYRFHDLRHQFLSMAHAAGADVMALSKCSGHATLSMLSHYTKQDVHLTRKFTEHISNLVLRDDESKQS